MVVHSAGRNSVNVWHLVCGGEGSGGMGHSLLCYSCLQLVLMDEPACFASAASVVM